MTAVPALEFTDSVLVVAHPDDEILWFGSVVERVDRIVICFLHDPGNEKLADARRRVLEEHPLRDRIECLGLAETGTFGRADWIYPVETGAGLEVSGEQAEYAQRARELESALRPHVERAKNIFTHNPWGEYGHEEHVMVHRVVSRLADSAGDKTTWFSNYASSWSMRLMLCHLTTEDTPVFSADVDIAAMQAAADVYRRHDAWTWFDDYRWFAREYFVRGPLQSQAQPGFGWLFPVNLIHLPDRKAPADPPGFMERAGRSLRRRMGSPQNDVKED